MPSPLTRLLWMIRLSSHTSSVSLASFNKHLCDVNNGEGAPGSGKGTLCKRLFDNHNVIHLSIGDILRDVATQQPTDPEIIEHVRAGTLAPVETLSTYLKMAMVPREQHDPDRIFLIDGAPRKLSQIEHLESTVRLHQDIKFP
jgi:adenylate kinase family enzyme